MDIEKSSASRTRKQDCLQDIQTRILAQDIAPGADLDEVALSAQYGISRTPLREVLQRLAGGGYVSIEENRGAKVASLDINVLRVFFQTAPLIYSTIAQQAADNRTPAQLDELKAVQREFAAASAGGARSSDAALLNHRFHELIGEMAHNPYLAVSLNRMLIDHTRFGHVFYKPASISESVLVKKASSQHDAMIAAIEAQEPALAVELTLQHWDLSKDRLERFVRPDPLPLNVVRLGSGK